MKENESFGFLTDEKIYSNAFAVQYAFEHNDLHCWRIVLLRKTMSSRDALDIAVGLNNLKLFISVIKGREFEPRMLIDTCEFLFSHEPAVWAALFELDYVVVYLEDLGVDSVLDNFATIKSQMFAKYIKDIYPGLAALSPVSDCDLIENECNAEDLLCAAENIASYTNKN